MSAPNESHPDSSDQGRQPQDSDLQSPFAARYEMPADQFQAEVALLDTFTDTYPDQAKLLHQLLTYVKEFSGMQIPTYRLDRPIADLKLSPEGYIEGDKHMIHSIMRLKESAPEDMRLELFEGTPAEQEAYAMLQDPNSIQEELPPYARAMIEGVYGLVGAEAIHTREEDGVGRIIRRGVYLGNPVYFEELRRVGTETGVVSYSLSMTAENHALFDANDEIYGADLQECVQLTGLSAHQVRAMNRSGELTRSNFRDQAALAQAVNEAMQVDNE